MKREKEIILVARIMSMVFTPFYLPIVGLVVLFVFSYLSMFSWPYKLQVLLLTYLFTILLPTLLIHLYRRYQGWNLIELGHRERRMVPYVISIICYFTCIHVMERLADCLCTHQRLVEDFHPHGSHRRRGRSTLCLCLLLGIQSCVVALSGIHRRRNCRHQPYDSATTYAGSGGRRILDGFLQRRHSDTFPLKHRNNEITEYRNNEKRTTI